MLKDEPKQPVPTSFEDEQDLMAFLPDDEIPTEDEIAFTILRHIYHANPQLFDDETKPSNETCDRVSVSYKDRSFEESSNSATRTTYGPLEIFLTQSQKTTCDKLRVKLANRRH